ncbi:response regulator [bacterium]|nr:MAG: response regulator [bacterium]
MLARRALRRLKGQVEVTHVDDGAKAIAFLEEALEAGDGKLPDAVLCDLKLPKRTGIEVLSWFRNQGGEVPFIMLTSSDQPDDIRSCQEAGADGYIQKPVDYDAYMRVMEEIERFWFLEEKPAQEVEPAAFEQRFIRFAKLN